MGVVHFITENFFYLPLNGLAFGSMTLATACYHQQELPNLISSSYQKF
jgi:hypothetical protein